MSGERIPGIVGLESYGICLIDDGTLNRGRTPTPGVVTQDSYGMCSADDALMCLEVAPAAAGSGIGIIKTNLKPVNAHTRATFVRPAVKEIALTTRIIDQIMPYYPLRCVCIAGYLDSSDQFWKVNYHWDLLVYKIDQFVALKTISEHHRNCAMAIKQALLKNAPDPQTGYRTDKTVGATKDKSDAEQIIKRHATLKQAKVDFESVLTKSKVVNAATKRNPPASEKPWWLAVAPVALPGNSKHGSGYALDISGDNAETTRISKALGATLAFNEASHVHVEWKNAV